MYTIGSSDDMALMTLSDHLSAHSVDPIESLAPQLLVLPAPPPLKDPQSDVGGGAFLHTHASQDGSTMLTAVGDDDPQTVVLTPLPQTSVLAAADPLSLCGIPRAAPGDDTYVDDCDHGVTMQWCCVCAGCMNEVWWCGRDQMIIQLHLLWWYRFLHAATWTSIGLLGFALLLGKLDDVFMMIYLWVFVGAFWTLSVLLTTFQGVT